MIVRKPTKIELKPEDDLYEYEEYKKKQSEILKKNTFIDAKQSSKFQDKMLAEPNSNPFKMSMANDIFKTPSAGVTMPHNMNPNQPMSYSSSQFDSFNLIRNQITGTDFDINNLRNESLHANQLFSILLNNLNSGQSFNNAYSPGNTGNTSNNNNDSINPNNNNSG